MTEKPIRLACAAGCKREATPEEAEHSGWDYLPIQSRWRCPDCTRVLREINRGPAPSEPNEEA
jgi:hypothetical protein